MALQAVVRTLASTLSKVLAIAKFIYVGCTIFFFFLESFEAEEWHYPI